MPESPGTHPNEGETATLPVFVRLLGVPSVTVGDQTLKFRYRKAEALLSVLVLERRRMPRSRVAQLLKPGADAKSATRNLRVVLNDVRAKIGERLVAPSDSPYVSLQRVRSDLDCIASLALRKPYALATDPSSRQVRPCSSVSRPRIRASTRGDVDTPMTRFRSVSRAIVQCASS